MNAPRRGIPALLLALACLASCAHRPAAVASPRTISVERDATWSGEVRIGGIVHVRKGATLTIAPGTRVLFEAGRFGGGDEHEGFTAPGIKVEGRIVAAGTPESPIAFAPAGPASPGSWDKILFVFSAGSRFEHCTFEGARYAFHAHFSEIAVRRCVFRGNEEGVRLGTSRVTIEDSVFTGNEVRGINFRECRNEIRGNLVYGNGDGIFLHSKNAASSIRGNALYANRGYDLRLGDLHAEDVDASGNWWGTPKEDEVRARIYDGEDLPGLGTARFAPILPRPPVARGEIRGVFVDRMVPVPGAEVRAYVTAADGFFGAGYAAAATTGAEGLFSLPLPPGRYYVVGTAATAAGTLFGWAGKNPVPVGLDESVDAALPSAIAPPAPSVSDAAARPSFTVAATFRGEPAAGVTVHAARADAPDLRGPGDASAVTGERGTAVLYLPPGRYILSARKRTTGAALGMVDEGGLYGVHPHSPVLLPPGRSVSLEIPLYEKRGYLDASGGAEGAGIPEAPGPPLEGTARLSGGPAAGYIVFFYRAPETIGRPSARSSTVSGSGRFDVPSLPPGEYSAWLRRAVPGVPGGAEEERIGPVAVRIEGGRLVPSLLGFSGK